MRVGRAVSKEEEEKHKTVLTVWKIHGYWLVGVIRWLWRSGSLTNKKAPSVCTLGQVTKPQVTPEVCVGVFVCVCVSIRRWKQWTATGTLAFT